MRLFDKCWSSLAQEHREEFRRSAAGAAVFVIDTIADYFFKHKQLEWEPKDFPYARPPWDKAFVEFNQPTEMWCDDGVKTCPPGIQYGLLCNRWHPQQRAPILQNYRKWIHDEEARRKILAADDVIGVNMFTSGGTNAIIQPVSFVWMLNSDGWLQDHILIHDKSIPPEIGSALLVWQHPALLAFTFANCSNVKIEDATAALQSPAKVHRRLKLPEVKRYTLNICGHSTTPRREGAGDPQEGIMPFHLCRGHFATYTPEKPMFGNPKLIGRYWHPPHTRGKKERGEIIKDYAIAE